MSRNSGSSTFIVKQLAAIMLLSFAVIIFTCVSSYAASETDRQDYTVAPGITESAIYVTVNGGQNVSAHILRIQKGAGVTFKASYAGYFSEDRSKKDRKERARNWSDDDWGYEKVIEQAGDYERSPDTEGEVIAATNGDFFTVSTGEPEGNLIIEKNVIRKTSKRPFLAVLKSGKIVIRKKGGKTSDAAEAIGGDEILLWKGKVTVEKDTLLKPREAIGICEDGTIVMLNVDGRSPTSAGVSMYDLALLMKSQGCVKALNFDGGGSATFITKREDDEELICRNDPSDGYERNIASALLVVTQDDADESKFTGRKTVRIRSSRTKFYETSSGKYRYIICGQKQTGFFSINGESYLFNNGKGMTADIIIGKVTYSFKNGRLEECSDEKAGAVHIGYCGAEDDGGKNLLYAYHEGDHLLNVGLNPLNKSINGKMKNWKAGAGVLELPWFTVRHLIRKVYIADGVTSVGNRFLYVTSGPSTGGVYAPDCKLRSVRLPSSLRKIGKYAFFKKPELKNVVIPSGVKTIGRYAFSEGGKGYLRFKSKKVTVFGKRAFRNTGFDTIYVRRTADWKDFIKNRGFRKYGFRKKIRYSAR